MEQRPIKRNCDTCKREQTFLLNRENLYYCRTCGSEAREQLHLQVRDSLFVFSGGKNTRLARQKREITSTKSRRKDVLGRPWRTIEGFQFVIMEQVKALIGLGANPELKAVVFRFWALYLRKKRMAFLTEPIDPEEKKRLLREERSRDLFPGTISDPQIHPYKDDKVDAKLAAENADDKDSDSDKTIVEEIPDDVGNLSNSNDKTLGGGDDEEEEEEDFFTDCEVTLQSLHRDGDDDEDDEAAASKKSSKKKAKKNKLNHSEVWMKGQRMKMSQMAEREEDDYETDGGAEKGEQLGDRKRRARKMTMLRTLVFSYLGLHFVNPGVQIYDLIRWVRQGKVPYMEIKNWPRDMIFSGRDCEIFKVYSVPNGEELFREVRRLNRYLGLGCFKPVNIKRIAVRLVYELGLPGELNTFIVQQVNRHPIKVKFSGKGEYVDPALVAMSYIVFQLKLLFGLDGYSERVKSDFATQLTDRLRLEKKLFNWNDWRQYAQRRHSQQRLMNGFKNLRDVIHAKNVGELIGPPKDLDTCFKQKLKDSKSAWFVKRIDFLEATRSELVGLWNLRNESNRSCEEEEEDNGSEEEEEEEDRRADGNGSRSLLRTPRPTANSFAATRVEKSPFVGTTLAFLTDGDFLKKLSVVKKRYGNVLDGEAGERFFGDSSSDRDAGSSPLNGQDLIKCSLVDAKGPSLEEILGQLPKLPPPTYLIYSFKRATKDSLLVTYAQSVFRKTTEDGQKETKAPEKSLSYLWLLDACSRHLDVRADHLEVQLQRLEKKVFGQAQELRLQKLYEKAQVYLRCMAGSERVGTKTIGSINFRSRGRTKRKADSDDLSDDDDDDDGYDNDELVLQSSDDGDLNDYFSSSCASSVASSNNQRSKKRTKRRKLE